MEKIVSFDKQGRIYVPEELRRYVQFKIFIAKAQGKGIYLEPIEEDPIEALSILGKEKLKGKSISQLKKETRAEIEENSPPPHFIELVSQQPVCVAVSSFNVSVCTATRMPINIAKKTKPKTAAKIAPQGEPSSPLLLQ